MAERLDSHIPDDGNEYLFTDTFPKGTGKGLIVVAIAAIISLIIYQVLPFDINANKGLAMLFFIGALWLTEALHVTITAILVVVVGVLIGIPDFNAETGLSSFANPTIYLFFWGLCACSRAPRSKTRPQNRAKNIINVRWQPANGGIFDFWCHCVFIDVDIKHRNGSNDVAACSWGAHTS